MSMTATAFLSIVLITLVLVLLALVDLIRATDMELGARMILAAALILVPPLGLLLWLFVRAGRTGAVLGATVIAAALFVLVGFAVGSNHSMGVVQSSSSGSFSVSAP